MSDSPLISVVVPVYNVEKYLPRCVDSILSQTYTNLEIILINDGSTDGSLAISRRYQHLDSRVRVIDKKNGGLSSARNSGIEEATGQLISFIDSDDWIEYSFIEKLYKTLTENRSDISVCSYSTDYEDGRSIKADIKLVSQTMSREESLVDILTAKKYGSVMAWNRLYKTSLFKDTDIRYPEGKIHEDKFTTYKLYSFAERVSYTSEALYHYIQRRSSIMGESFSIKRLDAIEAANETTDFFKGSSSTKLIDAAEYNAIVTRFILLDALYKNPEDSITSEIEDAEKQLLEYLSDGYSKFINNNFMRPTDKLRLWMAVKLTRLYSLVSRIR